jgi:pentatricopeptide repeat protein
VSNGALDDALAALKTMQTQIPDFSTPQQIYATLIKGFASRRETGRVMEVYKELKANDVQLDLVTYNCLLDAGARGGDMERCSELFREMCTQGVTPDLVTYTTVIKGYCVNGELEQAVQLFTLMRKRGIKPDLILFNAILDGCARKQMTSISSMMLGDMESSGVTPSNQTLSILVKMYGKAHDLETAMELTQRLPRQYGFEANSQVHMAMLTACVTNGRLALAQEVFQRLSHPDAKAFQTLITGCLKNQDVAAALDTLGSALSSGVKLEPEIVESVAFMAQRRRMSDKLAALQLQKHGYSVGNNSPREATETRSKVHARRQASQSWRDASPDSE